MISANSKIRLTIAGGRSKTSRIENFIGLFIDRLDAATRDFCAMLSQVGRRKYVPCVVLTACLSGHFSSANAVILNVDASGLLTGASGVLVSGSVYDVTFDDGTCEALFSGCDSVDDFEFTSEAAATAAANALLDQVFVGDFDTDAAKTRGCPQGGDLGDVNLCTAMTPFGFLFINRPLYMGALNFGAIADTVELIGTSATADTSGSRLGPYYVWAKWSPQSAVNVPLPGTLFIMVLGLSMLGLSRRRTL
jgi:hypothetical protein